MLCGELAFDHQLGGDAGMIGAREPKSQVPAHAAPAGEDVHLGVFQHVAHVQPAGDIGRGQQHGEDGRGGGCAGVRLDEELLFDPVGRPTIFDGGGVVGFG